MLDRVRIWTLREAGHTLEHIAVEVGVTLEKAAGVLDLAIDTSDLPWAKTYFVPATMTPADFVPAVAWSKR